MRTYATAHNNMVLKHNDDYNKVINDVEALGAYLRNGRQGKLPGGFADLFHTQGDND